MASKWVSNNKYFCKYCHIYITENKSSRSIHEGGKKHKDAKDAFLRDVHKRSDEKSKEDLATSLMLAKIDQAAMKQYSKDTNTHIKPSSSSVSKPAAYYDTAQTPSYVPTFVPKSLPSQQVESGPVDAGTGIGEWSVVESAPTNGNEGEGEGEGKGESDKEEGKAYVDEDEEVGDNVRGFKVVEKCLPVDDEIGDAADAVGAVFRKRKVGGKGKEGRNVRRRSGD